MAEAIGVPLFFFFFFNSCKCMFYVVSIKYVSFNVINYECECYKLYTYVYMRLYQEQTTLIPKGFKVIIAVSKQKRN